MNTEEKKLVGTWTSYYFQDKYMFTDKGTFIYIYIYIYIGSSSVHGAKSGNFKVSGKKITFTNIVYKQGNYPNTQVAEYKLEKSGKNEYLIMRSLTYPDLNYLPFNSHTTYSKMGS